MIADGYDAFLFDLDGVLYRGLEPVPGAARAVLELRRMGKRLAFVTNNSSRTAPAVAERLTGIGIAAAAAEVETSALATADLLRERGHERAFVVGQEGIVSALRDVGIEVVAGEPDAVDVVVVGWDGDADYEKLKRASILVQRGAALVATNADATMPAPDGRWPGAGALLAAIETATGVRGDVVGKPYPTLLLAALVRAGGDHPLVVGDRLDTDIAGAAGLGWDSMLVLTGISRRADLATSDVQPTFVAEDLSGLFSAT